MRTTLFAITILAACRFDTATSTSLPDGGATGDGAIDIRCPPGFAGASCVIALHDHAAASCASDDVEDLRRELDARADLGPLWADGRALFRTDQPAQIAGTFNAWSPTLATAPLCDSTLVVAVGAVESGHHAYKLLRDGTWLLDAHNPAFAYDDFAGNVDGRNSVLNTHDSGRGHLIALDRACSQTLGNCRDVTAYLPAGYAAPQASDTRYPVLFVHDGKNVWDDHDCCFGHTGWELNITLDAEIAAERVVPVIVIAADQTSARNAEYGLDTARLAAFMAFQVDELQPRALAQVRATDDVYVAGSSLGGLASMELALHYPQTYRGVASLSGAFWPGMTEGTALRDRLPALGKQALAIYLDHGGSIATNSDGAADSIEVRDVLVGLGWQPSCTSSPSSLCYFHDPGGAHDELAWNARAWRFLRFLLSPPAG